MMIKNLLKSVKTNISFGAVRLNELPLRNMSTSDNPNPTE